MGLRRLMVLDADLEVYCDLRKLWQHFQHFSSTQVQINILTKHILKSQVVNPYLKVYRFLTYLKVLGVGLDQSPHYFSISSKYREANPETSIGKPGDLSQVGQLNIFLHKHFPGSEHWGGTVQFGWDACQ